MLPLLAALLACSALGITSPVLRGIQSPLLPQTRATPPILQLQGNDEKPPDGYTDICMPAITDGEGENCDELANAAYIRKSMADNPKVEVVLAGFVVLSAVLFAAETLPGLSPMTNLLLTQAEAVTVIV